MPVRKIPRSHRNLTACIPWRGQSNIRVESSLELGFVLLCQFDGAVVIEEQPVRIPLGKGARYTPDFLVHWPPPRGTELIEVKPHAVLTAEESRLAPKFAAARTFAEDRGWTFRIVTDREIRTPKLQAVRFLLRFRHRTPDTGICARLLRQLQANPSPLCMLMEKAFPESSERLRALPCLWHLVANRIIAVDLDQPLNMSSLAWLSGVQHDAR